jgi:hypothetical protein
MRKIRPDATAYNNCKSFKFSSPQASEQVSGSFISLIFEGRALSFYLETTLYSRKLADGT